MPLEIKELVIKATIDQMEQTNGQNGAATGGAGDMQQEMLVNLCVDKVLEILKERTER